MLETKTPFIEISDFIQYSEHCVFILKLHKELCNTVNSADVYFPSFPVLWQVEIILITSHSVVEHVFVEFIGIKENIHTSFYYP